MSIRDDIQDMYKVEPKLDDLVLRPVTSIKPSGYETKQIGGLHYVAHTIQPWDIIDDWDLDYYLGNVIKYVLRDKNDKVEDLHKAIHYLEKKIELLEKE